jgi:type I restriction enzyme M protein
MIEIKGEDLINRMDYWYYHNLKGNSIKELVNNGLKFAPLRNFIVYCKTGKTLYGKERKFSDKGLRFLHATNITDIGINYKKDERFIDPSSKMNFPDAYAKVGDILFVRVGVGCAGRVAIVDTKEDEGIATDYIHILRVNSIDPYFLVVYLKTRFGKDSINLLKHGVGTVSINKTDLLSLQVPIVTKNLQLETRGKCKNTLAKYRKNPDDIGIKRDMALLTFYLEERIENLKGEPRYVEM